MPVLKSLPNVCTCHFVRQLNCTVSLYAYLDMYNNIDIVNIDYDNTSLINILSKGLLLMICNHAVKWIMHNVNNIILNFAEIYAWKVFKFLDIILQLFTNINFIHVFVRFRTLRTISNQKKRGSFLRGGVCMSFFVTEPLFLYPESVPKDDLA